MSWVDHSDVDVITVAAAFTGRQLVGHNMADVRFAPGDATEYRLLIIRGERSHVYVDEYGSDRRQSKQPWTVICYNSFGRTHRWDGRPVATVGAMVYVNNAHAAQVVARFLTALSVHVAAA